MRIVIDTNIAFSAILNTDSLIARIILQPKSKLHFYSTDLLLLEIAEHKDKLRLMSGYSSDELGEIIELITAKIRFINARLIPSKLLLETQDFIKNIEIDDTEFVALAIHIKGRLWSGDKMLQKGLLQKGWTKFITTADLYQIIKKRK
jgi:predicted nucleic acid-binding protein